MLHEGAGAGVSGGWDCGARLALQKGGRGGEGNARPHGRGGLATRVGVIGPAKGTHLMREHSNESAGRWQKET